MWREIVAAATYLYNQTSCILNGWKSFYEAFYFYIFDKEEVSGLRKPQLHHLRAYSCKAYVLTKSKDDARYQHKLCKLDSKSYIGFLVGYESINIYRVWVPHKKKIVSVQDIIFDKDKVWDDKPIQYNTEKIKKLDNAIKMV